MAGDPENTNNIAEDDSKSQNTDKKVNLISEKDEKSKRDEKKAKFSRKSVAKLSIINCIVAAVTVALGVPAFIESATLPYWVARSAFAIWFGFLILATAVIGAFAIKKPTSFARSFMQALLNVVVFVLTVMSLAFYGKALMYYKGTIDEGKYPSCAKYVQNSTLMFSQEHEDCLKTSRNKAILLCSIFGVLIVVSLVELFVSFVLLVFLRKPLHCCCRWFIVDNNSHGNQTMMDNYSMYVAGCSYGPSFGGTSYLEYQIDATPLRPPQCKKQTLPAKNTACFIQKKLHGHHIQANKKRPPFRTMESINETQELNANELEEEEEERGGGEILTSREQEKREEVVCFLTTDSTEPENE